MAGNQKHLFGKTMPLGSWTWCPCFWSRLCADPRTLWLGHPLGCGVRRFSPALPSLDRRPRGFFQGWAESHVYALMSGGGETIHGNVQILPWEGRPHLSPEHAGRGRLQHRRGQACFPVTMSMRAVPLTCCVITGRLFGHAFQIRKWKNFTVSAWQPQRFEVQLEISSRHAAANGEWESEPVGVEWEQQGALFTVWYGDLGIAGGSWQDLWQERGVGHSEPKGARCSPHPWPIMISREDSFFHTYI